MTEDGFRRGFVGVVAGVLIIMGIVLWILGLGHEKNLVYYYGACWRLGPVLALWWLAWNEVRKVPSWAFISIPIIVVAMLIHKKLLLVAIPLAILLSLMNHPRLRRWFGRGN